MKSDGEIKEILAAYDLTGSLRAAAALSGCSHHTAQKHVAARDAGRPIAGTRSARARWLRAVTESPVSAMRMEASPCARSRRQAA